MRYIFAGCALDTSLYSLHRAGQQIALRPKVFQVLLYLLDHRDRVVTKQELLEAVWPEQYISEATLADCIRDIRQAMGEIRGSQRIIQTRHGHGYHLAVEVLVEAAAPQPGEPDTRTYPGARPSELAVRSPVPAGNTAPREEPRSGSSHIGAILPQADLAEPAPLAPMPASAPPPLAAAERRQVTVMSCALVDAPGLEEQRDPEDWYDVIQAWQETCTGIIEPWQGYIVPHVGHELLVYFGYPYAHEDDARRAVFAGLDLLAAFERLHTRLAPLPGPDLAVHIGIHTGLVIIGRPGGSMRPEHLATGATLYIATCIQALARSNTLLISDTTARLVQGYVVCQDAGQQALQEMATPVQLWHVLGITEARSRLESVGHERLTPLVGREEEMALLCERWRRVQEGEGQVVLLSGEAGIGKSRLAETLRIQVASEGVPQIILRCSPSHTHSALFPVLVSLQQRALLDPEDTPATKLDKLEQMLCGSRLALEQVVPLFAALLAVPLNQRYPPVQLTPERQKQQTHEALVAWLLAEAERQPIFVLCEDLHWADPSTLELLNLWMTQSPMIPALTLLLFRPEFHPPWTVHAHCAQLTLRRFTRAEVEQMLTALADGTLLPADIREQVIVRTDGVPLFVEELVKMLRESKLLQAPTDHNRGAAPRLPLTIPASLQGVLMARLDRLGGARDLAQLGATWGREFTYAQMQSLLPQEEITLRQHLVQLVEAEILYQRGLPPQASYRFKHTLIQESAYQSLVRSTRQAYHGRIAHVLAVHFPETAAMQPELLAHHYTEAGLSEQAVVYWQGAGERAITQSAHMEALGHLSKGLTVLMDLPDTSERMQHELALQIAQGVSLTAIQGYGAPEVERAYTRARALCQQLEETAQLFPTLYGLWRFYLLRAEYATAQELGEHLLTLAESGLEPTSLAAAHRALGSTLFYLGELPKAYRHLQYVMTCDITPRDRSQTFLYDVADVWITCHAYAAWTLWLLGYPDQARQLSDTAITMAQDLNHPFSYALALSFDAWLQQFCGIIPRTQERAVTAMTLSTEQGFKFWMGWNAVLEGWTLAKQGDNQQGIVQMRQGLADWHAIGSELGHAYFLTLVAEVQGERGELAEGLHTLAEAQAFIDRTSEHWWEAELYRLKGELLLRQVVPDMSQAVACFHHALEVARQQNGKSLELRAAKSLSRLWQQQGKQAEAHTLLAPIYNWFSEGFDTADLQDAKALLEALAPAIQAQGCEVIP